MIFAIGIALLVGVFWLAVSAFLAVPETLDAASKSSGQGLIAALAGVAARVGFLAVMAYVSSLVASKGLELFSAARGGD